MILQIPRADISDVTDGVSTTGSSLKVLLVDDDCDCVESSARILEKWGYTVFKAYSVKEALELAKKVSPDAIITDDQMPDGGGASLLRKVQKLQMPCPFAVLSGDLSSIKRRFRGIALSRTFEKPADMDALHAWLLEEKENLNELKVAS